MGGGTGGAQASGSSHHPVADGAQLVDLTTHLVSGLPGTGAHWQLLLALSPLSPPHCNVVLSVSPPTLPLLPPHLQKHGGLPEEPHSCGGARQQDVPRDQRHKPGRGDTHTGGDSDGPPWPPQALTLPGDPGDELGEGEDELLGAAVLHQLPVDAAADAQVVDVCGDGRDASHCGGGDTKGTPPRQWGQLPWEKHRWFGVKWCVSPPVSAVMRDGPILVPVLSLSLFCPCPLPIPTSSLSPSSLCPCPHPILVPVLIPVLSSSHPCPCSLTVSIPSSPCPHPIPIPSLSLFPHCHHPIPNPSLFLSAVPPSSLSPPHLSLPPW